MSFEKLIFDVFRVPYYDCWVFSRGQFYKRFQKKVSSKRHLAKMMSLKAAFIAPKWDMIALHKGSAALVFYELANANPMELKEEADVDRDMADSTTFLSRLFDKKVKVEVEPSYFVESRIEPALLHEILEADIVHDIMAKGKYEIPSWVGTAVIVGLIVIGIIVVLGMVNPAILHISGVNASQAAAGITPVPTPTGYIIIKPGA